MLRRIHLAFAFLTIFPGPRSTPTEEDLTASVAWYPVVGFGVGVLLAAAAALLDHLFVPRLLGPCLAGLLAWMTRGLHWDGLADVADAWGSAAQGERFWGILKDSRIGSFGVLAIAIAFALQTAALTEIAQAQNWCPLILGPVVGRLACLFLAYAARPLARPGLGSLALRGVSLRVVASNLIPTALLAMLIMHPGRMILLTLVLALWLRGLHALAKRHHGINGDFLGAAIVGSETLCFAIAASPA
jgi:adenosylcobinamide-GDP ribazoletransferase